MDLALMPWGEGNTEYHGRTLIVDGIGRSFAVAERSFFEA